MNRCRDCHFLVKHYSVVSYEPIGMEPHTEPWDAGERTDGLTDHMMTVSCWRGIWKLQPAPYAKKELDKDRGGGCFFFQWQEGLDLESANELRCEQYENTRLEQHVRLNRVGVIAAVVSAIGAIVSAIFNLL